MRPLRPLALWLPILISQSVPTVAQETTTSFSNLAAEIWDSDMHENPILATQCGDHRFNAELPSISIEDALRRNALKQQQRRQLEELSELSDSDKVNRAILLRLLSRQCEAFDFKEYLIPITNRQGFHIDFPDLAKSTPFDTAVDYKNYIARLRRFQAYAQQHIELMRVGIQQGYTLPSVVLEGYAAPIEAHIVEAPQQSVFYAPFQKFPESIRPSVQAQLAREGREAILTGIVPGYEAFLEFMRDEYVPSSRGSVGAAALPNGRAYYRFCVRKFTTLPLLPDEVHSIGMAEVKRIRAEMESIREGVSFEGNFATFLAHMRTAPQFYATNKQALLERTAYELKKMDGLLPALFKTLPRTPYGIREIPDYIAPQTTSAYYMPPSGDGRQAGYYYVNTYKLESRPLYGVQALSLHEAVPGHHLQLALQQEMEDMPRFRRFAMFTAFVEGWALYAERLGLEVGFYTDPYDDFGRLTYEMWRACRLVVDTGLHYFGWSRQRAIEFMETNSGLSKHNIRAEVDRYIAWPGQALAYKIGELKIRELRAFAEDTLGPSFDIREFHDVVLGNGAIPLDVLENNVRAFVAAAKDAEPDAANPPRSS